MAEISSDHYWASPTSSQSTEASKAVLFLAANYPLFKLVKKLKSPH
ncbi:MAG: hypothetical protein ACJA0U_000600 [Salibacteraceae bacterium]|jgi:hypothetical protein